MIGGSDIVISARGEPETLDTCARVIREFWPNATFQDARSGTKFETYQDLPFGRLQELLVYADGDAEAAWDRGDADVAENSMVYLILSADHLTIVSDDPNASEMHAILESIRSALAPDILGSYAEAA
jgi:hypothetical protein